MSLSENFFKPIYDDAPWLSDQLLLPNMARGHSIHILSAFVPSYIFKLVKDLAQSEEIEPGFLNLVLFIPGDLKVRSESIARFKKHLLTYSSDWEVSQFAQDCLQLIKEGRENDFGGLQIQVQHTSQKKPLTRGLAGIIVDPEEPSEYASFVDAKGGDFNSPVKIRRSWDADEHYDAQEVLGLVVSATTNQNPRASLVSSTEVEEWLIYLANYYESNPPTNPALAELEEFEEDFSYSEAEDDENEPGDQFLNHLKELDEFSDEDKYGWFDEDDDEFDLGSVTVSVSRSEARSGHIPPLEAFAARFVIGESAVARCICGKKFYRADGCDEVMWDSYDVMRVPDFGELD